MVILGSSGLMIFGIGVISFIRRVYLATLSRFFAVLYSLFFLLDL